jgi:nitrite reductase/ring-hydroxylating ferredoxin subunit/uncharacterized membrane protein
MKPLAWARIPDRIERLAALDPVAETLQKAAQAVVPQGSQLKDLLSGTWLGHPVHPPLTDVVIGTWTSALLLDRLGGERAGRAADRLVAAGILAAVPTAASGFSDWAELRGGNRRVGTVHAVGNTAGLVLNVLSWRARRRGDRGTGVALSAAGYAIAATSAWLGGHLAFAAGVGVNRTAFEDGPSEWTAVYDAAELEDRTLTGAQANGMGVLLVRSGDTIHALSDTCSHRGCALREGELRGDTVVCPCHGSTFGLDGSIVKGPATSPQPRYQARVRDGRIEIQAVTQRNAA